MYEPALPRLCKQTTFLATSDIPRQEEAGQDGEGSIAWLWHLQALSERGFLALASGSLTMLIDSERPWQLSL